MKNLVRSILLLQCIVFGTLVHAQTEGSFKVDNTSHYFGTFSKSKGKVSHKFIFTNTGNKPLLINRVKSTCGCTASKYTREPILPGKEGSVEVRFDPAKFSGYFSKKVSVYTNAQAAPVDLTVSGRIRVNHRVTDDFNCHIGDLRADSKIMDFGDVEKLDQVIERDIKMINVMRDSIKVRVVNYPSWLKSCEITKDDLTQGDNTRLMFQLRSDNLTQWGELTGYVGLEVQKGIKTEVKNVRVTVNLIDTFSLLTDEQKELAPKITVDSDTLFLDNKETKLGDKKVYLYNEGQTDLIIRNVQVNEKSGVEVKKYSTVIKPGKKTRISVDSEPLEKPVEMTIWSNDPKNYMLKVIIK